MNDFLDKELEKSSGDIDVDKVEAFISKFLIEKGIKEPTKGELRKKYNEIKKKYLSRQRKKQQTIMRMVLVPLTMLISIIVIGSSVYVLATGNNIFDEFVSLFKNDEYTIIDGEEIYVVDNESEEINTKQFESLDELIKIEPQLDYLSYFSEYIYDISYTETDLAKQITAVAEYNDKEIIIRAYLYEDIDLAKTMFEGIVSDTPNTFDLMSVQYHYNDEMINFIENDCIIYTIYNLEIVEIEQIIK